MEYENCATPVTNLGTASAGETARGMQCYINANKNGDFRSLTLLKYVNFQVEYDEHFNIFTQFYFYPKIEETCLLPNRQEQIYFLRLKKNNFLRHPISIKFKN